MRQLILNADGFGFTFGNNRAILEVLGQGFVRSVSVNTTFEAVRETGMLAANFPDVSIGVHLNLTVGPSILPREEIPTLVDSRGEFHGNEFVTRLRKGSIRHSEMVKELKAQIRVLLDQGIRITHWDSHQGRHLYSGFFEAALEAAKGYGIPCSRTHKYYVITQQRHRLLGIAHYYLDRPRQIATHFMASRQMRKVRSQGFILPDRRIVLGGLGPTAIFDAPSFLQMLDTLPEGTNFLEVHPGYPDDQLKKYSSLIESREKERAMLMERDWVQECQSRGIELISYRDLIAAR